MLDTVRKLALKDNRDRKAALIQELRRIGAKYTSQCASENGLPIENIIVSFGQSQKRIVIGAHYDSVDGSTGANDNASGVSILLALIQRFRLHPPKTSMDFVFFDQEEAHALGSKLYVRTCGVDVLAMINLDICGVGDQVLIAPQKNLIDGILADAVRTVNQETAPFQILTKLPDGDDGTFEDAAIPNISVCILEQRDVQPMSVLFSGQGEVSKDQFPSIIETMHNGTRDSIAVVTESALAKVFRFTYELLQGFDR